MSAIASFEFTIADLGLTPTGEKLVDAASFGLSNGWDRARYLRACEEAWREACDAAKGSKP